MKNIIEYKEGVTDYNVGDVVFLAHKKGKPTCRAIAINNDSGSWTFKPLGNQSYYLEHDGLIPFRGKPYIFAKQIETEEGQL